MRSQLKTVDDILVHSGQNWQEIHSYHFENITDNILEEPLYHNEKIQYKNNTLYLEKWKQAGLLYVDNIVRNGKILSSDEIKYKTGKYAAFVFEYNAMVNAINTNDIKTSVRKDSAEHNATEAENDTEKHI